MKAPTNIVSTYCVLCHYHGYHHLCGHGRDDHQHVPHYYWKLKPGMTAARCRLSPLPSSSSQGLRNRRGRFPFFNFNRGDSKYHGGLRSRELCQTPIMQALSSHSRVCKSKLSSWNNFFQSCQGRVRTADLQTRRLTLNPLLHGGLTGQVFIVLSPHSDFGRYRSKTCSFKGTLNTK